MGHLEGQEFKMKLKLCLKSHRLPTRVWVPGMHWDVDNFELNSWLQRKLLIEVYLFEWKWLLQAHMFANLVCSLWDCFGKIRRCGLVEEAVSLALRFEKPSPLPVSFWPYACRPECKLSATAAVWVCLLPVPAIVVMDFPSETPAAQPTISSISCLGHDILAQW